MKEGAFLFALRAAAKVAFATTATACAGSVLVERDEDVETDETETEEGSTSGSSASSSSASAASSTVASGSSSSTGIVENPTCEQPAAGWEIYDPGTFACCVDVIATEMVEGALPIDADEKVQGCCTQLVTDNYEALWSGEPLVHDAPADVLAACCVLRHGNPGCTPWGPPTPPHEDLDGSVSGESRWLDVRAEAALLAPAVPVLPALSDAAIETWRGRMANESASSSVFAALARQLEEAGAPEGDVLACDAFSEEERRHGVLCGAVVEALGGEAIAVLPAPEPFPRHEGVSAIEAAIRNVLSVGCLSETVAVALIGAERAEMPEGELRDLLTRIWADEIGHARFGWSFVERELSRLDDAARARLSLYLRVAFRHLERHELAHLPVTSRPPSEGASLGLCDGRAARNLFYATVTRVIVPRLDQMGLMASLAWESRNAPRAPASLRACA
jgi:hypothetical protein